MGDNCSENRGSIKLSCLEYNTSDCSHDCFYARNVELTQNFIEKEKMKYESCGLKQDAI